jgi:site-specific DNA recombinase
LCCARRSIDRNLYPREVMFKAVALHVRQHKVLAAITVGRLAFVPFVCWALWNRHPVGVVISLLAFLVADYADGGTTGRAPIGYLNVRKRISGHEVRTVEIDPDRAPYIEMAFRWYATGDYSISAITEMLGAVGLRSVETAKRPSIPLVRSLVHATLRDDYYIGVVTYDGVKNPNGEHPPLIDRETFERVQELLKAHQLSGDRSRKYEHYLKGSIFCGECGGRLVYSPVKGNGGYYEYFKCYARYNRQTDCTSPHLSVEKVELAVERCWREYPWLTDAEKERVRTAVQRHSQRRLAAAKGEAGRAQRRIDALKAEQLQLLQLSYKGLVDDEVLAAEQIRIQRERAQSAKWMRTAKHTAEEITQAIDEALALLDDPATAYQLASGIARRMFNQATFDRILTLADGTAVAVPSPWILAVEAVARRQSPGHRRSQTTRQLSLTDALDRHEARKRQSRHDGGSGLNEAEMVRPEGFEPPTFCSEDRRSNPLSYGRLKCVYYSNRV